MFIAVPPSPSCTSHGSHGRGADTFLAGATGNYHIHNAVQLLLHKEPKKYISQEVFFHLELAAALG